MGRCAHASTCTHAVASGGNQRRPRRGVGLRSICHHESSAVPTLCRVFRCHAPGNRAARPALSRPSAASRRAVGRETTTAHDRATRAAGGPCIRNRATGRARRRRRLGGLFLAGWSDRRRVDVGIWALSHASRIAHRARDVDSTDGARDTGSDSRGRRLRWFAARSRGPRHASNARAARRRASVGGI